MIQDIISRLRNLPFFACVVTFSSFGFSLDQISSIRLKHSRVSEDGLESFSLSKRDVRSLELCSRDSVSIFTPK